jgi:peptide/nickel transport system ATP-binding protein
MLDVSIKSGILSLLKYLIKKKNLSLLYITHDLATVGHICQNISIMYLGKVVETGPVGAILDNPYHPYTRALISAIPIPDPKFKREAIRIQGAVPDPINLPPGCRFNPRCPRSIDICAQTEPALEAVINENGHRVACHHPLNP